jgi:hypothetical protein
MAVLLQIRGVVPLPFEGVVPTHELGQSRSRLTVLAPVYLYLGVSM